MSTSTMKLLVINLSFIALCSGSAIPLVPGDNSHYVEGESRYIWMPDGEGIPQLVDLKAPANEDVLRSSKQGAENAYWLYTRSNPTAHQVIVHGDSSSILNSNYDGSRPLRVIVHGWTNNGNSEINPLITAAFLSTCDCNVIVVDWSSAAALSYVLSVAAVPSVGQYLGNFLIWLISITGGDWNNVHIVGHSLGAHVVGNAGRTTGSLPARVTGLDPAGPLFVGNSDAMTSTDGQYVEAIHTDGGVLGILNPIGLANFYPNGGSSQPGCSLNTCNHGRVNDIFAASVYFDHFIGQRCADLEEATNVLCSGDLLNMGNDVITKTGNGIFGLSTQNSWPF